MNRSALLPWIASGWFLWPALVQAAPTGTARDNLVGATPAAANPADGVVVDGDPETPGPSGAKGTGPTDEKNGLITLLRVDAPLSGKVTATLKGPKETLTIDLNDAGKPPDVTAGDNIWAGLAESAPLSVQVSLTTPDGTFEGGTAEWAPDDRARELRLQIRGTALEVRARKYGAADTPANIDTTAKGAPPLGDAPPQGDAAQGLPPAANPPTTATDVAATTTYPAREASRDAKLVDWLGVAALLIAVAAFGAVLFRRPKAVPAAPLPEPLPLRRLSERGILGAGTPPWSGTVSVWSGPDALLEPLLTTLALGRPVVVAGPPHKTLPAVWGGPIFRAKSHDIPTIVETVRAVHDSGGLAVGVLLLTDGPVDEATRQSLEQALPSGVGAVIWGEAAAGVRPAVELSSTDRVVTVRVEGKPIRRVRITTHGFDWD
jgi:hypothetical protein